MEAGTGRVDWTVTLSSGLDSIGDWVGVLSPGHECQVEVRERLLNPSSSVVDVASCWSRWSRQERLPLSRDWVSDRDYLVMVEVGMSIFVFVSTL